MTSAAVSDIATLSEQRAPLCDTTQKAGSGIVERFEFDNDYVVRLRGRDAATWQHFESFFRPKIRAKFRAKLPWAMAEDLASATMLAAIESIDRGEPRDGTRLAGYVLAICHNKVFEALRTIGKENHVDFDFDSLQGNEKTPLQESIRKEDSRKIQRVLAKLSKKDRDVLVCIHYYGQDRDEVCNKYGVKRDHLKLILFHARQRFQREWGRD